MLTGPMTARRSNAKDAYNLMSDISAYILEEPKRVFMGEWLVKLQGEYFHGKKGPACGTVGCIAGNASVLTDGRIPWSDADFKLGGDNEKLRSSLVALFFDTEVDAPYGTKKYARIIAKRIAEFQKEHEDELRAVRIGPKNGRRG